MPDTTVPMKVGDKVGLLWTSDDYIDTFAGQEVEIAQVHVNGTLTVRTSNAIELTVNCFEVAAGIPPRKRGRKPIEREPEDALVKTSIVLRQSDMAFLFTINPKNVSAAIRKLISEAR